jgi:flagellar motor switch protein FliM
VADKILTDEERDALLDGVDRGDVVTGSVTTAGRDVRRFEIRPDAIINFGSYPRLQQINDRLAKRLAAAWTTLFRQPISVVAADTWSAPFADVLQKLPPPMITTMVALRPLPGHALLAIDNALLASMVDCFFGGAQAPSAGGRRTREEFTSGELRVAELATERLLAALPDAWRSTLSIEPAATGREINPAVGTGIESQQRVIVCGFAVETERRGGQLFLVMPETQIEPVSDRLEGADRDRSDGANGWRDALTRHMQDVRLTPQVCVGHVRLPLRRIVGLRPGDLLPLADPQAATLLLGDRAKATGRYGAYQQHNAFRLSSWRAGASNASD